MFDRLLSAGRLIAGSLSLAATPASVREGLERSGPSDWLLLLQHADRHGLSPLLYDTWRQAGALQHVPEDAQDRLARAYADNGRRNQFIRAELVMVHRILTAAGVQHLVLKGWPLAEQLYSDPAHRVLYDHDLLAPAGSAEVGHRALRAAGFVPAPAEDQWVKKHLPPLWRNDGYQWDGYLFDPLYPRPVELHTALWDPGWYGLKVGSLADPWAAARTCTVAGVPMQLLSLEDTLIHLAVHFAVHLVERAARLNQLLDLARFVEKRSENLDWNNVIARAQHACVGRFVYASLLLAHKVFAAPLPPQDIWRQLGLATPPGFQDWLAVHGPADVLTRDYRRVDWGKNHRIAFLAAASLTERIGIVRRAVFPPADQLVAKYRLSRRWLVPVYYPRHFVERLGLYGRARLSRE